MGFGMILMRLMGSMRLIFKSFFLEYIDLNPLMELPPTSMLSSEADSHISYRESPNCSKATKKRFFNKKIFGSDLGYLSRSVCLSIFLPCVCCWLLMLFLVLFACIMIYMVLLNHGCDLEFCIMLDNPN